MTDIQIRLRVERESYRTKGYEYGPEPNIRLKVNDKVLSEGGMMLTVDEDMGSEGFASVYLSVEDARAIRKLLLRGIRAMEGQ